MFSKKIHLESKNGICLDPIIYEKVGNNDDDKCNNNNDEDSSNKLLNHSTLTLFVWQSALVLASYLLAYYTNNDSNKNLQNLKDNGTIIEIGAGVGLPSVVAALLGFKKVIISDRENEPIIEEIVKRNIGVNNIENFCTIQSISWGNITTLESLPIIDIILGSDIFYSTEDFDIILLTISKMFEKNNDAIFLTTYQERSSHRTIKPYLMKYKMKAKYIPLESFMHSSQLVGECLIQFQKQQQFKKVKKDNNNNSKELMAFDNIYMIEISLKR